MTTDSIDYRANPRFHGDGIPVYFGSSKDSRLIYDAANDEWTLQTKNAAGSFLDRLRVKANQDATSIVVVDSNDVETPAMGGLGTFGDGSDGDVTISGNTTLTTDMYYGNLTIDSGIHFQLCGRSSVHQLNHILIAELKTDREVKSSSPFCRLMRRFQVMPSRFSKYCIGCNLLYNGRLKANRFKLTMKHLQELRQKERQLL